MSNRIRNNNTRLAVFLLTAFILIFSLSACSQIQFSEPLGEGVLFSVDEEECALAEAILRLYEYKALYETDSAVLSDGQPALDDSEEKDIWDRMIGKVSMADYVKDSVKQEMLYYTVSCFMADDMAVYLTEEESDAAKESGMLAYSSLYDVYNLYDYDITQQTAIDLYMHQALYQKVYDALSDIVNTEISTADTKVIKVNYVLVPSGDDGAENTAEAIRQMLKNGTDFKTACETLGYKAQMNQVIKKGDNDSDFEKIAYALKDGEISDVVNAVSGFYVIECIEDYMVAESVSNNNEVLSNAKRKKFEETYSEYASGRKLRFDDEAWDKVDIRELG